MIGDSPNNAAKEGIDWPSLRKENPDVVGWLTVEGTSISYPVTSERGEHAGGWYLKHDFWGRASTLGCPYIDPRCTTEASHILIYGHTVDAPDSMFTPLSHAYEQQTFSLIGDAHWSTPEHGDATFKPLMQSTSMPYTQTSSSSDSPATVVCAPFCAPFPKTPHAAPKTRRNLSNGLAVYSAW